MWYQQTILNQKDSPICLAKKEWELYSLYGKTQQIRELESEVYYYYKKIN